MSSPYKPDLKKIFTFEGWIDACTFAGNIVLPGGFTKGTPSKSYSCKICMADIWSTCLLCTVCISLGSCLDSSWRVVFSCPLQTSPISECAVKEGHEFISRASSYGCVESCSMTAQDTEKPPSCHSITLFWAWDTLDSVGLSYEQTCIRLHSQTL